MTNTALNQEDRLAALTGFKQDGTGIANAPWGAPKAIEGVPSANNSTSQSLLSDEDLEEQITRHSFASSPLSKLLIVAGGVFFIVFIASLFLSQFQSPGESAVSRQSEEKVFKESPLLSKNNEDKEKAELLSELALREQEEHLRNLSQEKPQEQQVVRPISASRKNYERPVVSQVSVPPRQQPIIRYTPPNYRSASVRPVITVKQEDPVKIWQEMAQLGSFGGVSPSNSGQARDSQDSIALRRTQEANVPRYQPKVAQVSRQEVSAPVATPSPTVSPPSDFHTVVFGQTVTALLESPIAWEGTRGSTRGDEQTDERYIVTLNEPLKDKFGNEEIPAGSQLVVHLASSGALVNLVVESIIFNGTEVKVSEGALKIRGADNQPLIAKSKTIGGDGGNRFDSAGALAEALSIAGDFADIPGSRSISSLYQTIRGGSSAMWLTTPITVWFLPAGTALEVYVNKPFSVSLPEVSLELDMSAINTGVSDVALAVEDESNEGEESVVSIPVELPREVAP